MEISPLLPKREIVDVWMEDKCCLTVGRKKGKKGRIQCKRKNSGTHTLFSFNLGLFGRRLPYCTVHEDAAVAGGGAEMSGPGFEWDGATVPASTTLGSLTTVEVSVKGAVEGGVAAVAKVVAVAVVGARETAGTAETLGSGASAVEGAGMGTPNRRR